MASGVEVREERREGRKEGSEKYVPHTMNVSEATTPKAASVSFPNGVRTVIYPEGNLQT